MADKTLEIADVHCTDQGLGTDPDLVVSFRDGRKIVTPLWWYLGFTTPRRSSAFGGGAGRSRP
jgi:hypothetical protein